MRLAHFWFSLFAAMFLVSALPAAAQLSPSDPDPLARIRAAAQSTPACSANGESLCEQVAPKLIANAQGESPLADNLRRLNQIERHAGRMHEASTIAWSVAAFRDAGMDVHIAKYPGGSHEQENVSAEIRGREKPDEWIVLGAHLDSSPHVPGQRNNNCDAAMVIEAARDILLTGIHPRRSIRFILFSDGEKDLPGALMYVRSHRSELDRARAAIILRSGCSRVTRYSLNGRRDIESALREALKPAESLGTLEYVSDTHLEQGDFDFVLEGVPTLTAIPALTPDAPDSSPVSSGSPASVDKRDSIDIAEIKRNTAIAAVTAFGIAERLEPLGPRQSRAEIESLVQATSLGEKLKLAGLWSAWESGERGRKR